MTDKDIVAHLLKVIQLGSKKRQNHAIICYVDIPSEYHVMQR